MIKQINSVEYLMGRIKLDDLTFEYVLNMDKLLSSVNSLMESFGEYRAVTSGYRSLEDQMRINPKAPKSNHMKCAAVDLEDKDGKLKAWCMANLSKLSDLGLWMESPKACPTWCHLQCVPPKSGSRVFNP